LDEIVEEEIAGLLWPLPPKSTVAESSREIMAALKRIAERAFRHGAERHALWVKSVGDAAANVVPQMVPAPAEHEYPTKTVAWGSVPGGWIDRRKGERRKVGHPEMEGTYSAGGMDLPMRLYNPGPARDWWIKNRRSGQERRK
jgi:hypothetical protein